MTLIQRRRLAGLAVSVTFCAFSSLITPVAYAAPADGEHLPDLINIVPTSELVIAHPSPTSKELRVTDIIFNGGDGPLEIRPDYDPATNIALGFQRIYSHNSTQGWYITSETPIAGAFTFHPQHDHYHFPLAQWGLFGVAEDGSVGHLVSQSPKVGFCISDSYKLDPTIEHANAGFDYYGCGNPTLLRGITVGGADEYNIEDFGQSIDITGVPDGTYWFRSTIDPDNNLREKDKANNIVDIQLRIQGDSLTILDTKNPGSTPPSVAMIAPAEGAVVSGTSIVVAATADDPTGVAGVQFLLDDAPLGPAVGRAPYSITWDTTTSTNGTHRLSAQATNAGGLRGTATPVAVTVSNTPPSTGPFTIDRTVITDGRGTLSSTGFDTSNAGELLVAFAASDGPIGQPQALTVSGAGLTWSLVQRTNSQAGTSEIWSAFAPSRLSGASVTSAQGIGGFDQSLTVVAFSGALGTGGTGGASSPDGAPRVGLTTSAAGSWVFGVGNDWDSATGRTLGTSQVMIHQWADTAVGDTFWVQARFSPTPSAGTLVILDDVAPIADRWNFTAVEVLAARS